MGLTFLIAKTSQKFGFEGESLENVSEDNWKLKGLLTICGVAKPITLDAEGGALAKDPWGNIKTEFSISGKINRKDFGLTCNVALETGGVLVNDEVKLKAEVQFAKA